MYFFNDEQLIAEALFRDGLFSGTDGISPNASEAAAKLDALKKIRVRRNNPRNLASAHPGCFVRHASYVSVLIFPPCCH
jgi:hypothetical protein